MASLASVVQTWQAVAADPGRGAKVRLLAACLRELGIEEAVLAVHYLAGEPPQGRLGVSSAGLSAAANAPPAPLATLTLAEVDQCFSELVQVHGSGAARRRAALLAELFARATSGEQHFLVRLIIGELRAGALTAVMLEAIAEATQRSLQDVRRASMYAGSLGAVLRAARLPGDAALAAFQLRTLEPLEPMLAQSASDVGAALERLGGRAAFEWKVDGARVQLHRCGDRVRIFTRRLNDVADSLPEIVELARSLTPTELVLDGEVIALDAAGRPLPFQITMRRFGRKLDVQTMRARLPLHVYFFDCLRLGEQTLIEQGAQARFEALSQAVPVPHRIPRLVTGEHILAQRFFDEALAAGHEGLMAKALEAPYEAGNRGASWLKIKRAHTLDLVVLAAEWGHGRRRGWLSNLHLGARAGETAQAASDTASAGVTDEFVMLGKTFKGLTDELLRWQTRELLARERSRDAMTVYVRPELVVEIAFNDIQASPQYPGGLALRFARVKRYRDDKSAAQADTLATVRMLYEAQTGAL